MPSIKDGGSISIFQPPSLEKCCEQGNFPERNHPTHLCLSTMPGLLGETSTISQYSPTQVTHRERGLPDRSKLSKKQAFAGTKSWSRAASTGREVGLGLKPGVYGGGKCLVG